MKNILAITKYTFREALSRKIFLVFFGVSTFILLLFLAFFLSTNIDSMIPMLKMQDANSNELVNKIINSLKVLVVSPLFGLGLFLSIFSAASFIPSMLEKGNVELILSKPISRSQIIWGKFWGGILIVLLNVAYLIFGLWVLIGFKFGLWDVGLLYAILTITYTFTVLYGLMILIGILTQSSLLAMMSTYLIFFILSPLLAVRDKLELLINNNIVNKVIDGLYYFFPKTSELASYTLNLTIGKSNVELQPILSSFLFLILTMYMSIIIFNKKDY